MAGARAGMKEAFAAVHECLPSCPSQRSESLVSDYSAAPRQNGVLSSLFPDPEHLDDVTTISVY